MTPSYELHTRYLTERLRADSPGLTEALLRAQLEELHSLSGDLLLTDSQFEKASEQVRLRPLR